MKKEKENKTKQRRLSEPRSNQAHTKTELQSLQHHHPCLFHFLILFLIFCITIYLPYFLCETRDWDQSPFLAPLQLGLSLRFCLLVFSCFLLHFNWACDASADTSNLVRINLNQINEVLIQSYSMI